MEKYKDKGILSLLCIKNYMIKYIFPYELIQIIIKFYIYLYNKYICVLFVINNCHLSAKAYNTFNEISLLYNFPKICFKVINCTTSQLEWVKLLYRWTPMYFLIPDDMYNKLTDELIYDTDLNKICIMNGNINKGIITLNHKYDGTNIKDVIKWLNNIL